MLTSMWDYPHRNESYNPRTFQYKLYDSQLLDEDEIPFNALSSNV